ncbi:hypothetical protein ABTM84_19295, partial [Acinetobacter baumannii]
MLLIVAVATLSAAWICTPMVSTVERLEALAQGDIDSPVAYTDHTDCTGRMTRAMAVFSAGAIERRQRLADD